VCWLVSLILVVLRPSLSSWFRLLHTAAIGFKLCLWSEREVEDGSSRILDIDDDDDENLGSAQVLNCIDLDEDVIKL
jgi:hypothetical protein